MKRIVAALLIATVAGLAGGTWTSLNNVSACIQAPVCINEGMQPKGKITTHKQGFPAPYRTAVKFVPNNSDQNQPNYAGYAETTAIVQNTNPVLAIINIIFWFPLVYWLLKFVPTLVNKTKASSSTKNEAS